MNNKGQTLVFFIAMLPVILILCAFIFDSALITYQNNKLNDIASLSIKYLVENKKSVSDVKNIINKNDSEIKIVNINNSNVHLKKTIDSIFGKIVGYNEYYLETNLTGHIENNKLVIKEKGN